MATSGRSKTPQTPVMQAAPRLPMDRFTGRWHETARLPRADRRSDDRQIAVTYTALSDQQLQITHAWNDASGREQQHEDLARRRYPIEEPGQFEYPTGPSWLRWRQAAWKPYWVLTLDTEHIALMIGEPALESLWIYAREPTMERATLEALKSIARRLGYDLAPLLISGTLRSFQPL